MSGIPSWRPRLRAVGGRKRGMTTAAAMAALAALALVTSPPPALAQDASAAYQRACDDGQAAACALLGLMYERGAGVAENAGRAATLYRQACEGGELRGCTNLGLLYQSGRGVLRSLADAQAWFRRSCDGGEALGCDLMEEAQRAAATEAGGYSKTGQVADAETGAPLPEAIVEVLGRSVRVVSDASGRVDLGRLPAGTYTVSAQRFGYEPVNGTVDVPGNADFLMLLPKAWIPDALAPGMLIGNVADRDVGGGLGYVDIAVAGHPEARGMTDATGRFQLRVPPGLVEVTFSRLGYEPQTAQVVVQPAAQVSLSAALSTRPIEVGGVEVTVQGGFLDRVGFDSRRAAGVGTFFSSDQIEALAPSRLSEVLQGRVPRVRIQYGAGASDAELRLNQASGRAALAPLAGNQARAVSSSRSLQSGGGVCTLSVVLDNVPLPADADLDQAVDPYQIEAIEVYSGIQTPVEFAHINPCGVIMIWTKR